MISFRNLMKQVEVKSPKDCVWFLSETSRCRLPGVNKRDSRCHCLEGEMDELCVWVTKFLKSSPKIDESELEGVTMPDDLNLDFSMTEEEMEVALRNAVKELLQASQESDS